MVLGKRARSSDLGTIDCSYSSVLLVNPSQPASEPPLTRVKRQAREEIFNDENENSFITQWSRDGAQDGDSMDLDELSEAIPTKHGVAGKIIPLSPSKVKHRINTNGRYCNAEYAQRKLTVSR